MDPGEIPELIGLIDAFQHDIPDDELSRTYLADALATSSVRIALTWLPQEARHQHTAEEIERQNRPSPSRWAVQGWIRRNLDARERPLNKSRGNANALIL
jgi:hypothetical protein